MKIIDSNPDHATTFELIKPSEAFRPVGYHVNYMKLDVPDGLIYKVVDLETGSLRTFDPNERVYRLPNAAFVEDYRA